MSRSSSAYSDAYFLYLYRLFFSITDFHETHLAPPFFRLCDEQLSNQSHYDFGLRALKSVLISAGNVKRDRIQRIKEGMQSRGDTNIDEASIAENLPEQEILIQSVCETMVPKLVAEDIPLLFSLLSDVFPNVNYTRAEMKGKSYRCTDENSMKKVYGYSGDTNSTYLSCTSL